MGHVSARRAAAPLAGHALPDRLVDDQRPPGVRRDLRDDARRAAPRDHGARLLPLQPGVRALPCRLRRGGGRGALRDHARLLDPPALARQPEGALLVMRSWPFSPRHLILMPLAAVMLLPLAWMLVTSIETLSESRQFP